MATGATRAQRCTRKRHKHDFLARQPAALAALPWGRGAEQHHVWGTTSPGSPALPMVMEEPLLEEDEMPGSTLDSLSMRLEKKSEME